VLTRLAGRLRRLYAGRPPVAVRERVRTRLAAAATRALVRRGFAADDLLPPNNARLLGALVYATDLDAFDRLAPGDGDVGPALGALVREARGAADPFTVLGALATRAEGR
jgi:hypothetical protein